MVVVGCAEVLRCCGAAVLRCGADALRCCVGCSYVWLRAKITIWRALCRSCRFGKMERQRKMQNTQLEHFKCGCRMILTDTYQMSGFGTLNPHCLVRYTCTTTILPSWPRRCSGAVAATWRARKLLPSGGGLHIQRIVSLSYGRSLDNTLCVPGPEAPADWQRSRAQMFTASETPPARRMRSSLAYKTDPKKSTRREGSLLRRRRSSCQCLSLCQ